MSLFKQLEKLYHPDRSQDENAHTEIVAQVLRNSDELTLGWLRSLGVTKLAKADNIRIKTQETFAKLRESDPGSRPDITIRIVADGKKELIFVESKHDAVQGYDQLQHYADQLDAARSREAFDRIALVFITRDYEPAQPPQTTVPLLFTFKGTRWFEFYQHLKARVKKNSDGLAEQLKLFMEEKRMSLGNQFRSTDLVAMESFLSAKALMDETLDGISEKATKILGQPFTKIKYAIDQMRDLKRYLIYSEFMGSDRRAGFQCLIGYWFPHENPDEPVWVGIALASNPKAPVHRQLNQAFRDWSLKSGGSWAAYQIDDETAWSWIRKVKAVRSFMGGEDHVGAIKDYLLALLEDVREFKKAYPSLPWSSASEVEADATQPAQKASGATI
ncbi:MAG: hypothetical protein ACLQU3_27950 [Limisphaerales bacterium]